MLSPLLRARVADAVERETRRLGTPRAEAAAVGRLARATLAAGALATAALLGAVGASRVESWREPPRSVRILLPVGTRALGEPVIVVRRASGREERR